MGMDVYGKNDSGYFRRSVWGWHPLAALIQNLHPELAAGVTHWHTNDGDGLDAADSASLAALLRSDCDSGVVHRYLEARAIELAKLPRDRCGLCDGTGLRTDDIGVQYGYDRFTPSTDEDGFVTFSGGCNGCAGRGTTDPWAWSYRVTADDVEEFADFLAACDGFEIL